MKKILPINYDTLTPYIYTFVRTDIPVVQQIVQSSHACHHAGARFGAPSGCHMILFEVANEAELKDVVLDIAGANIDFHLFYEPDPVFGSDDQETPMGYSALCTRPMVGEERRLMEPYNLWGVEKV